MTVTPSTTLRARVGALAVRVMPEPLRARIAPPYARYRMSDIPDPAPVPRAPVRLFVGPANFAGQGHRWARAAELLPGVGAVSMATRNPGGYAFEVDEDVPVAIYANSGRWQRRQEAHLAEFTHVLLEASRPLLGRRHDNDPAREIALLRARGLTIAMVAHGSEVRLPSRHAAHEPASPFTDPAHALTAQLEAQAATNLARIETLAADGVRQLVSTPDLLLDVPGATWLPVVVDAPRWAGAPAPFERDRPVVVHAPSNPWLKGTDLLAPVLRELHDDGVIEYRELTGVPAAQMPAAFADADVVLDQVRLGSYGVAACEAMASGRLVLGHLSAQVRDAVREASGLDAPIVEAGPEKIRDVLTRLRDDRDWARTTAARGPAFVAALHDGTAAARALAPVLGVAAAPRVHPEEAPA